MYLSMFESFTLWLESRGSSRKNALFRAGVAFSLYTLIALMSVAVSLAVIAGVPLMGWISSHDWSIWLVAVLIAVVHWYIARKVSNGGRSVEGTTPSLRLWYWYVVPVLALFVAAMVLAIGYTTH